jgi:hypothetical protein
MGEGGRDSAKEEDREEQPRSPAARHYGAEGKQPEAIDGHMADVAMQEDIADKGNGQFEQGLVRGTVGREIVGGLARGPEREIGQDMIGDIRGSEGPTEIGDRQHRDGRHHDEGDAEHRLVRGVGFLEKGHASY